MPSVQKTYGVPGAAESVVLQPRKLPWLVATIRLSHPPESSVQRHRCSIHVNENNLYATGPSKNSRR